MHNGFTTRLLSEHSGHSKVKMSKILELFYWKRSKIVSFCSLKVLKIMHFSAYKSGWKIDHHTAKKMWHPAQGPLMPSCLGYYEFVNDIHFHALPDTFTRQCFWIWLFLLWYGSKLFFGSGSGYRSSMDPGDRKIKSQLLNCFTDFQTSKS